MNIIANNASRQSAGQRLVRRRLLPALRRFVFLPLLLAVLGPAAAEAAIPSGRAINTRDEFVRRKFEKAVEVYSEGRYADARRAFTRLLEEEALSSQGHEVVSFMIGKCFYKSRQCDSCQIYFDRFLEALPHSPYRGEAILYIGHCQFLQKRHLAAARSYTAALQAGPEPTREIARANLIPLIERGLGTRELDSLAGELDVHGAQSDALLMIGERLRTLGRGARAEAIFRRLVDGGRRSPAGRKAAAYLEERESARRSIAVIGVLAPLTGDYADYGRELEEGIRLAAEIYGDQLRLHFADTHGDSAGGEAAARLLLTRGCDAIIGPLVPEAIRSSAAILRDHDIVQVLPLSRRGDYVRLSPHLFQLSNSPRRQARRLAEYALNSERMQRLGVLAPDTQEGHTVAEVFSTLAMASGAFVHSPIFFQRGETDFLDVLSEWRDIDVRYTCDTAGIEPSALTEEQVETIRPSLDGILLWGEPENFLLAVPMIRFQGFRPQYLGSPSWEETEALDRIRSVLDSVIFTSDEVPDTSRMSWKQFRTQYRDHWRAYPSPLAARGYDLVRWLLGEEHDDRRAAAIAARLAESDGFEGVGGRIVLGPDRRPKGVPVYRFRGGVPIRVSDD